MDYRAYPILYVDDEATNLQAMEYLLEDKFTLLTASSGEQALEILNERNVAVLIADMRMPGMNGAEVCARARQVRPDVVPMLMTAYADVHAAVESINRGQVTRYISRPYRDQELLEILRNALDYANLQRGVRDVEVRLLRGGPAPPAVPAIPAAELAEELDTIGDVLQESIEEGAQLLAALAARLRAGQPPRSPPVRCDAVRAVHAMVRILRPELERTGELELQIQGVPTVPMEASALGQVVMALLTNAAQARDPQAAAPHRMIVRVGIDGDDAVVSVTDNGVGIFPEDRERIFDPYFTTRAESLGLGLAIARELVNAAGGTIDVFSEPKMGSTFTVRLPNVKP
jgi:signal transduction histidine kinase